MNKTHRILVIGQPNDTSIFMNNIPNCSKLFDVYLSPLLLVTEYGLTVNTDDNVRQYIFVTCSQLNFSHDLFKNIISVIICINKNHDISTIFDMIQTASTMSPNKDCNMCIWCDCNDMIQVNNICNYNLTDSDKYIAHIHRLTVTPPELCNELTAINWSQYCP